MMQEDSFLISEPAHPTIADSVATPDAPMPLAVPLPTSPVADPNRISRATRVWGGLVGCLGAFMLMGIVLMGITGAFAFSLFRQPPVTSDTTQTFAVSAKPQVTVRSSSGDVQVVAGTDQAVTVRTMKSARALSQQAARQLLNEMQVSITQNGNQITVSENETNFINFVSEQHTNFLITVPAQANLEEHLSAGTLHITGVAGIFTLENSAGDIRLSNVTIMGGSQIGESAGSVTIDGQMAPSASLGITESAGNITFTGALTTNDHLSFSNSAGDITLHLPQATVAHIDAHDSAGGINLHGWTGILGTQDFGNASAMGDTGPNPTNTITLRESAGSINISAT